MQTPLDPRSTGRKWARKAKLEFLAETHGTYACEQCGRGPVELPNFPQLTPAQRDNIKLPEPDLRDSHVVLQVDHADKNVLNPDLDNLTLLCVSCHKNSDLTSAVGVAKVGAPATQTKARDVTETGYWIGAETIELV